MYTEDDLLPISALQHLRFCRRRCALIHLEGLWTENRFTAEGNLLHRRVHEESDSTDDGVRISRGLRLASLRLGLFGVADVVEFHGDNIVHCDRPTPTKRGGPSGLVVEQVPGQPFPVEYKRGKRKPEQAYRVQLCAQALCLEEMLGVDVSLGALYFGKSRRRMPVEFDLSLRQETERLAAELHQLLDSGQTPPPEPGAKCKSCSMQPLCLPKGVGRRSAVAYVVRSVSHILDEQDHEEA
ncbi:MAG: CRISPR-associated protein Cas4 [Pirellulales bacterium]|nr:CRISPR-associated protein Cas4 [Pirellulales bacterium]